MNKINGIENSIISTLAYFDMHKYPLTLSEIWKWLYVDKNENKKIKISEIQKELENSENLKKVIGSKNGFYFLRGSDEIVDLRRNRHKLAQPRWKKLKRMASFLQLVPNVRMVAACNTLSINDIKPGSDIDVFIIVKDGRIWQTRFMITMLVALLGQWRHKERIDNMICLSFYITDGNMDLESIAKKPYDIYLNYWVSFVFPVLDRECYEEFINKNGWAKKSLPNFMKYNPVLFERKVPRISLLNGVKKISEKILCGKFGDIVEKFFRKIQIDKMKRGSQSWKRDDTDVIISDQMLKFHEGDRRDEFRKLFEKKLSEIGAKI